MILEFSISRMEEDLPFNNMDMVDDLIVPMDSPPEAMQQMVSQSRTEVEDITFTTRLGDDSKRLTNKLNQDIRSFRA